MSEPLGNPPGPIGWPLLGELPAFRRDPARFLLGLSREYGDLSFFRIGLQRIYLLNRPDLIEEVLVSGQGNFIKTRMLQRAKTLLGEGLLTSEGALHHRQRRLASPAFYRDRLAAYAAVMVDCARQAPSAWENGRELDVPAEMMRLTLAIVGLTLFGIDIEEDAAGVGRALTDVIAAYDILLLPFAEAIRHLPFGRMRKAKTAQRVLDAKIYRIIAERRTAVSRGGDLLSTLLQASEDPDDAMTDTQVRDEAMTLMLAGHETTANALTWTWYLLSQSPVEEARLREEWREVLGGRDPAFADLPKLPCTERVVAESLRLYPPAWVIGRMAVRQVRLFNHLIPPGAICLLSPYVMHRTARYWPDPERFDPDRFIPERRSKRPKFAYFPFGGGPRVCIGERFAQTEAILLLAAIGQKWRFRLAEGQRIEIHPQVTLRPRYGLKMVAERMVA